MNPSDIQKSFEERQGAVNDLQTLVDEVDGAEFSGEQEQTFQRLNDQIDGLDTKIRTGLEHLNREKESAEALEDFRSYNNLTAPAVEVAEEKTNLDLVNTLCTILDELIFDSPHKPHKELINFVKVS